MHPNGQRSVRGTCLHSDAWLGLGVASTAFVVYLATLASGLTFGHSGVDGGDLVAAARTLGVPHPSGYPTYVLLARLFILLPVSNIAYRANLLSAVCAAAAVGLLYACAQTLLPRHRHRSLVAAAAALTLGFSPLHWSQAVIAEVYGLLALFASLLLFLLTRWHARAQDQSLWLAGLALGLGLGNHLTLVLVVPAAALLLWRDRQRLVRPRTWLPAIALLLLGLGVYAYLPLAASRHPPVNWGDPVTWNRFLWVVTGQPYRTYLSIGDPRLAAERLAPWAQIVGSQFGWLGLVIAILGAWVSWHRARALAAFGLVWFLTTFGFSYLYRAADSYLYLLPAIAILALSWAQGACYIVDLAERRGRRWYILALVLVAVLPITSVALNWGEVDLHGDQSASVYSTRVLDAVAPGGLVITQADGPTFSLWYAVFAERQRPNVAVVNAPLLVYDWYREQIRRQFPGLLVPDPAEQRAHPDELARDLITLNFALRPVYATDPASAWEAWFLFVQEGTAPVYRVQLKGATGFSDASLP